MWLLPSSRLAPDFWLRDFALLIGSGQYCCHVLRFIKRSAHCTQVSLISSSMRQPTTTISHHLQGTCIQQVHLARVDLDYKSTTFIAWNKFLVFFFFFFQCIKWFESNYLLHGPGAASGDIKMFREYVVRVVWYTRILQRYDSVWMRENKKKGKMVKIECSCFVSHRSSIQVVHMHAGYINISEDFQLLFFSLPDSNNNNNSNWNGFIALRKCDILCEQKFDVVKFLRCSAFLLLSPVSVFFFL